MSEPAKLLDIIREAGQQPQYQEMMEYLHKRRAVPPVSQKFLGDNVYGEFAIPRTANSPLGPAGAIRINMRPTLLGGVNTLTHEVTHAAERQIDNQYSEEKYPKGLGGSLGKNQFTDAWEKLTYAPNLRREDPAKVPPQQLMELLAPKWRKDQEAYRSTTSEARAFAVGNSTTPKNMMPPENAPAHIDSTIATEFMILLDLARRSMDKRPAAQGR